MEEQKHSHFMIHKPFWFLSQFVTDRKKARQRLLGELYDFPDGTMAIGRLDQKSEGLLLLTTDGKMSEYIRGKQIEKEYYVQVDGAIDQAAIDQMCKGVEIGFHGSKYITKPCKAFKIADPGFAPRISRVREDRHGPTSWISVTVTEGKFRQVRKMTAAVGFPTLRLVRWRVHDFCLEGMEPGEVRKIKIEG